MPTVLPITPAALAAAVDRLRRGGLVAFPTETVYGLGGSTFDPHALEQLYALKGRPSDNPIIAHVHDTEAARRLVARWDDRARELAARFWPGPLTLVLPKAVGVPDAASAGRPTIAVRCPAHPGARLLLQAFRGPISAPSANRSGRISPTTAEHVAREFAESDLLVLDAGPCALGIESTVLELVGHRPRLLRPGSVTQAELESVVGPIDAARVVGQDASPGTRDRHYAPTTPARVVAAEALDATIATIIADPTATIVVLARRAVELAAPHHVIHMPSAAVDFAARLYSALRDADAAGVTAILVEAPPDEEGLWHAVADRLRRACSR